MSASPVSCNLVRFCSPRAPPPCRSSAPRGTSPRGTSQTKTLVLLHGRLLDVLLLLALGRLVQSFLHILHVDIVNQIILHASVDSVRHVAVG